MWNTSARLLEIAAPTHQLAYGLCYISIRTLLVILKDLQLITVIRLGNMCQGSHLFTSLAVYYSLTPLILIRSIFLKGLTNGLINAGAQLGRELGHRIQLQYM